MRTAPPLLARLRAARNTFGAAAERDKRALLRALSAATLATAAQVSALHEDLLFLCAFPGSRATRALARRMLAGVGARVNALPRAQRTALDDSGIAESTTRHVFPHPVARWVAQAAPADAEIDWRNVDDPAVLDALVRPLLTDSEREAFDSGEFATRDWMRRARRTGARSDLEWLIESAAASAACSQRFADAWDDAEIPVAWRLRESRASVTHNALTGVTAVPRSGMRRPADDVIADIARPLPSVERLPRAQAQRVASSARAALAARCREVNAMTYPNLDEVWWCELGEGAALAVIGIAPAQRLTLETNTGYLLFANGVPIGYGGVTPLYRQANTGINVFDPFRGSEAAFLWTQMLRAFRTLYGSGRFVINAYQFGAGNAEAIASGAFWFYYRLGFRPAGAQAARLAAREARRMVADRKYRSDARTLRALAVGDLHLDLPGFSEDDHFDEALLPRVGALAACMLAREPVWSRTRAARRIAERLAADLAIDDFARWSPRERRGFEFLAPAAAALPELRDWAADDRAALAAMLRAKGAPQERGFALKAQRAPRFFRAMRDALRAFPATGGRPR
jgi:hypothetical protein